MIGDVTMSAAVKKVVIEPFQIRATDPEFEAEFEINGVAPVQAIGTAFGRTVYFRARHDEWSFEVADDTDNLPSDGQAGPTGFFKSGKYSNASYMPLTEALRIVELGLREFAARTV